MTENLITGESTMQTSTKSGGRRLGFESLECRAMFSFNGFTGVGPTLSALNNFEGPAAYGESIPQNNNLFLFSPVQATTRAATAPANSPAASTRTFLESGVLIADAANQLGVLGTDIELASGSLGGAVLGGIQLDLRALSAALNSAASGSPVGPVTVPIDILAGVSANTSAQVGGIVQAIQGTLTNVANDIQSIQGSAANPASDVSGIESGLSNAFRNILDSVSTLTGAGGIGGFAGNRLVGFGTPAAIGPQDINTSIAGSGFAGFANSQSGNGLGLNWGIAGNLPVAALQNPFPLTTSGGQLNLNPLGALV
jgi:hypothetical protein